MIIKALEKSNSLWYEDFSSLLYINLCNPSISGKIFLKIGLLKVFPVNSSNPKNLVLFEKKFKPKNKITNSLFHEKSEFFEKKSFLYGEPDSDHTNLTQAILVKYLKVKECGKIDNSFVDTKKTITITKIDPRGLKIQMENLFLKNFISFSKKRNKVKFVS